MFVAEKVVKLRRERTYTELKELAAMGWKEMIECYMEYFVRIEDHELYSKRAGEDQDNALVEALWQHFPPDTVSRQRIFTDNTE